MSRIGPRTCWCCGAEESTSGCVLGPRCSCNVFANGCFSCGKCDKHCACTKQQLFDVHEAKRGMYLNALVKAGVGQDKKEETNENG